MKDYLKFHDCKNNITVRYKGPFTREYENDKKEVILNMEAFDKDNNFLDGWEYVYMRSDPHNPNPNERFFISTHRQLYKSGHDLVDKILSHR